MYSLVVLLSLLASASFVLAFVHGRRAHRVGLVVWTVLLLYTHNWGLFLAAGMVVAGVVLRADGAWVGAAVAVLYALWLPRLVVQVLHTGRRGRAGRRRSSSSRGWAGCSATSRRRC
jgi:mannosyltransferase